MQKEQTSSPKQRTNIKRTLNASTPDRLRNVSLNASILASNRSTSFRHRTTMAPLDFIQPRGLVTKRYVGINRQAITSSLQQSSEGSDQSDVDGADNELGYLYDKDLQALMTNTVVKKKVVDKDHALTSQLATLSRELDIVEGKFNQMKLSEKEIKNLTAQQNDIDAQAADITTCIDNLEKNSVMEILSQLKTVLEPLDCLRCKGIVIPENSNELDEIYRILKESSNTLKSIRELIGDKANTFQNVKTGLDDFIKKYGDIESVQQKLDEALCSLQTLVLREASRSLSQSVI